MALNAYLTLGHSGLRVSPFCLGEVSKPTLNFPAAFLQNSPMFMHGSLSVNGIAAPPFPLAPKSDKDRW